MNINRKKVQDKKDIKHAGDSRHDSSKQLAGPNMKMFLLLPLALLVSGTMARNIVTTNNQSPGEAGETIRATPWDTDSEQATPWGPVVTNPALYNEATPWQGKDKQSQGWPKLHQLELEGQHEEYSPEELATPWG